MTQLFGCNQTRVSKSEAVIELLGSLDELNSYLGVCKSVGKHDDIYKQIEEIQNDIFIIQAIVAGSDKTFGEEKIKKLEDAINTIEAELSPITTFLMTGGALRSAHLDFARTLARRAERRAVTAREERQAIGDVLLKYLNRLSSFLYALARQENKNYGIKEKPPRY